VPVRIAPDFARFSAEQRGCLVPLAGLCRNGGQRQFERAVSRAANFEVARLPRAKSDALAAVTAEQDMAACESRVPAQADLADGREPAQFPIRGPGFVADDESRLGEVILLADLLQ